MRPRCYMCGQVSFYRIWEVYPIQSKYEKDVGYQNGLLCKSCLELVKELATNFDEADLTSYTAETEE